MCARLNAQVERDRGITVKAQSCSMIYHHRAPLGVDPAQGQEKGQGVPGRSEEVREAGRGAPAGTYLLNLIDTPGHVDFAYEVANKRRADGRFYF